MADLADGLLDCIGLAWSELAHRVDFQSEENADRTVPQD